MKTIVISFILCIALYANAELVERMRRTSTNTTVTCPPVPTNCPCGIVLPPGVGKCKRCRINCPNTLEKQIEAAHAFFHGLEQFSGDLVSNVFTPNGVLDFESFGRTEGRAAIKALVDGFTAQEKPRFVFLDHVNITYWHAGPELLIARLTEVRHLKTPAGNVLRINFPIMSTMYFESASSTKVTEFRSYTNNYANSVAFGNCRKPNPDYSLQDPSPCFP